MAEEPILPSLSIRIAPTDESRRPKRVKLHSTSSPLVSSDPPFFSSDDDPSAENYSASHGRRKRRFRGPWYSQKPADKDGRKARRTLQRQLDSGIWLGSDSTDGDADADFSSCIQLPQSALHGQQSRSTRPAQPMLRKDLKTTSQPSPEELAEREIEMCLETGKEDIDLSARGLTHLSNSIIKPLATIVSIPMSSQGISYHPLRPKLKLFLSSNSLRRIPGEVFNLDNVTVLSLRNNLLVDLPSAVGRLRRLVELNLANNNLHFLPYEILSIFSEGSRLHSLTWHPNPFFEPYTVESDLYKGETLYTYPPDLRDGVISQSGRPGAVSSVSPSASPKWNVNYKFRTQVRFMNIDGTLAKGPSFPRDESLFSCPPRRRNAPNYAHHFGGNNVMPVAPDDDVPEPPPSSPQLIKGCASNAPSLLELALKKWSHIPHLPNMNEWLGYEPPEQLGRIMADAKILRQTEADARECTICARHFIVPRTEWLEWWQISKIQEKSSLASAASPLRQMENRRDQVESLVPFVRRGCSWKCLPQRYEPYSDDCYNERE